MPVSIEHMRDLMMPGLIESFTQTKGIVAASVFDAAFAESVGTVPLVSVPISLPAAVAIGAAAVVIKNPTVTRRFISWFTPK